MRVVARRREGYAHEVEIEGGHTLLVDEPPAAGGADSGPSPTRLLAASLASCIAITMEMYAGRKDWDLGDVGVEVETEYDGPAPTSFAASVHIPGPLSDEQRERLLSVARRCPVHKALVGATHVSVSEASGRKSGGGATT